MKGYIYLTTDLLTGKQYVGQHHCKTGFDTKYKGSGATIKQLLKERPDTFECHLIAWQETEKQSELDYLEEVYIELYQTVTPNGYNNISYCGCGVPYHSEESIKKMREAKKNISEETRKKMSEAAKGKHLSEETRNKLSESIKGHKGYWLGKHLSEETRKKMSEAAKGKSVLQYDKQMNFIAEWQSISEAERQLKIGHIIHCCQGKRKSAGGFIWRYKDC